MTLDGHLALIAEPVHDESEAASGADTSGTIIDSAEIAGGGHLYLVQHDDEFEILCNAEQLMSDWTTVSERALATLVCARLGPRLGRMLIGGLGMGFTLTAALEAAPASASIVVAELVPKVLEWARGPLAHLFARSLGDPRATVALRDVHDMIAERRSWFDAILLDVDNGPDSLVCDANERLYCDWGLRAAHAALAPGGILAIWSAYSDAGFTTQLERTGFTVEEVPLHSEDAAGRHHHVIWLATRP